MATKEEILESQGYNIDDYEFFNIFSKLSALTLKFIEFKFE